MTKVYCDRCGAEIPLKKLDEEVTDFPVGTYVPVLYIVRDCLTHDGKFLSSEPALCAACLEDFVNVAEDFMKGNG